MSRWSSAVIGIVLGLVFLGAAALLLDWHEVWKVLSDARWTWVLTALAVVPAYIYVKALRWRVLMTPVAATTSRRLLPAVWAGNAGNYLAPHFGELVRVMVAGEQIGANRSALLATIGVERFFDFTALGILAAVILLPGGDALSPALAAAMGAMAVLAVVLLAVVMAFLAWPEPLLGLATRVTQWLSPRVHKFLMRALRNGMAGLSTMRKPALVMSAGMLSLAQWVLIGVCVAASMKAVALPVWIAPVAAVVLLNVAGLVLPAAPGHVGTIQLAFIVGLQGFGIGREPSFAASLVFNAAMVVPVMLIGFPILSRAGVQLGAYLAGRLRIDAT